MVCRSIVARAIRPRKHPAVLRHRAPREGVSRRKLASCAGVVGLGQAEAVADAAVRGLPHVAERGLPAVWAAAIGVAVLADPGVVADANPAPGPAAALTLHPTVHLSRLAARDETTQQQCAK